MSRPRVLVTGATGFIAQTLVPRLVEHADVTLLLMEGASDSAFLTSLPDKTYTGIDTARADLRDFRTTRRAVQQAQPERVIHLAAAGVSNPFLDVDTALDHNVTGTLNLLRACFEAGDQGIRQVIIARTPGERTLMNVYAASKAAAWGFCRMYVRTAGWPIHGAMIYQAYGPHQPAHTLIPAALRAAKAGEDFPMTSGEQRKDWIHVDDISTGFLSLLGADLPPGETVELGTGISTSVREVVEQLYRIVDREGQPIFGALPDRPGEEQEQSAAAESTAALIGWRATIPLSDGLAALAKFTG